MESGLLKGEVIIYSERSGSERIANWRCSSWEAQVWYFSQIDFMRLLCVLSANLILELGSCELHAHIIFTKNTVNS